MIFTVPEPPHEQEITSRWLSESPCMVSVCMLTYNHAPYLRDALNGILNQKTDFGFEILIHDDASTDDTQSIINDYHSRYPKIIKPILQSENQWSKGINPSIKYNYPRANAKYIAWCEGDDLWIDDSKLSTQVHGLEGNPNCNLSFHQAFLLYYGQRYKEPILIGNYSDEDRLVSFHESIYRPYGLIPTASCIVRKKIKDQLLWFMKDRPYIRGGDVFLQMLGSMEGGALYYAKPLSIYRYQTKHSLTRGWRDNLEKTSNHQAAVIRAYLELNMELDGAIRTEIKVLIFQRILWLFNREAISPFIIKKLNLFSLLKEHLKIKKLIKKKAFELSKKDKKYIIYGCGSGCLEILRKIDTSKVLAVIDRDNKKIGEEISSKPIISERNIGKFHNYDLIVSTLHSNRNLIEAIAIRNGLSKNQIQYFYDEPISTINIDLLIKDAQDSSVSSPGQQPQGWWIPKVS